MKTISYLLSILLLVLCVMIPSTALVIPIGGLLDDPLMQGTIAIDDSGNVAYTMVAVLNGEFTSEQVGWDQNEVEAYQKTQASTEDGAILLSSGAYDAHGSFAVTGDLLVGEGAISGYQVGGVDELELIPEEHATIAIQEETIAVEDGSAYSGTIAMDSLLYPENYMFTGNSLAGTGILYTAQQGYFDRGTSSDRLLIYQHTLGSLESGEAHTLTYVSEGPVWSQDFHAFTNFNMVDKFEKEL